MRELCICFRACLWMWMCPGKLASPIVMLGNQSPRAIALYPCLFSVVGFSGARQCGSCKVWKIMS